MPGGRSYMSRDKLAMVRVTFINVDRQLNLVNLRYPITSQEDVRSGKVERTFHEITQEIFRARVSRVLLRLAPSVERKLWSCQHCQSTKLLTRIFMILLRDFYAFLNRLYRHDDLLNTNKHWCYNRTLTF